MRTAGSQPDGATFAKLTPGGRGAVATIAVWGPGALVVVEPFFRTANRRPVTRLSPRRPAFGQWRHASGEEDVVVCVEDQGVEIHCHGGEAAVAAICQALQSAGAAPASPQQWVDDTNRDVIAAEAHWDLSAALTERAAGILLDQFNGALTHCLEEIVKDVVQASPRLARLAALAPIGSHLSEPWRVVLAGSPNVGKSSLTNRLLGYDRAIVFDRPGTTRDALTALTAIDGWPVEIVDTAGVRDSQDPLEQLGVERARQSIATADIVLLVRDPDTRPEPTDTGLEDAVAQSAVVLPVLNKADLLDNRPGALRMEGELLVSAKTGQGVPSLWETVARKLAPEQPAPGEAVPFRPRHRQAIQAALNALRANQDAVAERHLRSLMM